MGFVDPLELISDAKWQIKTQSGQNQLPIEFMSFMAHGNLVPTSFKQVVLKAENEVRQRSEQQRQVLNQEGWSFLQGGAAVHPATVFFILEVRRDQLVADTTLALERAQPEELQKPLKVKFKGEEGIDEGGVTKEYFRLLSAEIFSPDFGMFTYDSDSRYIWFNPASINDPVEFWMVGVIVGLAVYNNIPGLDVNFPMALFKKLINRKLTPRDFGQAFPTQESSLQTVLNWIPPAEMSSAEADQSFQDTFCLDFSTCYEAFGEVVTINLEGDSTVEPPPVTLETRGRFAAALRDWYLNAGVKNQFDPFKKGFNRICGATPIFNCLSASELEAIVAGEKDLDISHLRKGSQVVDGGVNFAPGYLDEFWRILESFTITQKRQFLKFVTGSDLAPVGGLERMDMKIQRNGGDSEHLPTSHTCFNLLCLPEYSSTEKLFRLLVTAIENAEGFGLQ